MCQVARRYSPSVTPSITYRHLPPGKHTLRVFLANNDHSDTGKSAEVAFTVVASPAATITAPTAGATVGSTVKVAVDLTDFAIDATLLAMAGLQRLGLTQLPVVAMTANAMVGDREKVISAGMNDHIAKPVKPELLYAALQRWLPALALDAPPATIPAPEVDAEIPEDLRIDQPGLDGDAKATDPEARAGFAAFGHVADAGAGGMGVDVIDVGGGEAELPEAGGVFLEVERYGGAPGEFFLEVHGGGEGDGVGHGRHATRSGRSRP